MNIPISWQRFGIRTKLRALALGASMVWATNRVEFWRYVSRVVFVCCCVIVLAYAYLGIKSIYFPNIVYVKTVLPNECDLREPSCVIRVRAEVCRPTDYENYPPPAVINPPMPPAKPKIAVENKRQPKVIRQRYRAQPRARKNWEQW